MKITILSAIVATGMASTAFGQGLILDNLSNSGGIGASTGGLLYENGSLFAGDLYNVGVTVLGGVNAGSLSVIGTYTPLNDSKGYTGASPGQFQLGDAFATTLVPGLTAGSGPATIELQIWDYDSPLATGTFSSYAAAVAGGDYVGTVTFVNGVSNPLGAPPVPAPELTGMPSLNLQVTVVPEPTTIALAGLGIASLLAFRRRK